MISFTQSGSFKNLEKFLRDANGGQIGRGLDALAERGVAALAASTPVESGKTANSWGYEIIRKRGRIEIVWTNSNVVNGVSVPIILQYGHATGTGGYVQGYDYINPAIKPIFDMIAEQVWKEVKK